MAELHASHDDAGAQGRLLATEIDGERAAADAVGEGLHERLAQVDRDVPHIPLALRLVGDVVGELETQLCLARNRHRVGEIAGVAGLVEIVSVVAEEVGYAVAFGVERSHREGVALAEEALVLSGLDETVGLGGKAHVGDGIDGEQRSEFYLIAYLALLGVVLGDDVVVDLVVEIAVVAQERLGDRRA